MGWDSLRQDRFGWGTGLLSLSLLHISLSLSLTRVSASLHDRLLAHSHGILSLFSLVLLHLAFSPSHLSPSRIKQRRKRALAYLSLHFCTCCTASCLFPLSLAFWPFAPSSRVSGRRWWWWWWPVGGRSGWDLAPQNISPCGETLSLIISSAHHSTPTICLSHL